MTIEEIRAKRQVIDAQIRGKKGERQELERKRAHIIVQPDDAPDDEISRQGRHEMHEVEAGLSHLEVAEEELCRELRELQRQCPHPNKGTQLDVMSDTKCGDCGLHDTWPD